MGKVTAVMMDVITEKSGHTIVPNAVSVCTTPAAPSPLPIPYPVIGQIAEGIGDSPMRTKVSGEKCATVGSVAKACHGNEPGTLKEVVSLNTGGPCFIIMGAPIVICELGMMGITGSLCISNKAPTPGAGGTASGAGGGGGGGGGAGGGGGGPGGGGPQGPAGGGGSGGGGSNSGSSASPASPGNRASGESAGPGESSGAAEQHQCQNGHPVDMATGYVVDRAVDISLPGLIPFVFKRTYSSSRHHDRTAQLGAGWAHSYELAVWEADTCIAYRDREGRAIWFEKIAVGQQTFHRGERLELRRVTSSRYTIRDLATRYVYTFVADEDGGVATLREIADAWDNRMTFAHEGGRLVQVIDTASREIRFGWKNGRIARVQVIIGGTAELSVDYGYAASGLLASVTDALGHTETFEYDAQARMVATTLKNGVTFRYTYEPDTGRCNKTWGPNGLYEMSFAADLENHRTFVDGEEPRVYTVDDKEHVTREALPDGRILEEYAYDADGFLVAQVNGAGEGTQYWYDARGNLIREVDAEGAATVWEYEGIDRPARKITADGLVTRYEYDAHEELIRVTYPTGIFYTLDHDRFGRIIRIDDNEGTVAAYEYDAAHDVAVHADPMGERTTYTHDALGRAIQRKDALGRVTRLVRDRLGHVVAHLMADGSAVRRTFDPMGNILEEVDPLGHTTRFGYEGLGAVTTIDAPDGMWRLKYTSVARLAQVKNPKGETASFVYDEGGRVIRESMFDGRQTAFRIGASGRPDAIVYADESARSFTYDRCGRLISDTGSDGSLVTFVSDKVGNVREAKLVRPDRTHVTVFERDAFGRVTREHQGDRTIGYAYDTLGRVAERTLPEGTVTRYAYNHANELTGVTHAGTHFDIGRDAVGQEVSVAPESRAFVLSSAFDPVGRLVEQVARAPKAGEALGEAFFRRTFRYDLAGRIDRVVDDRWGMFDYRHDGASRLLERFAAPHGGALDAAFRYDPASSLVGILSKSDTPAAKAPWKVAPGNVLVETPSVKLVHDARGRRVGARDLTRTQGAEQITEYKWDVRDRMLEARLPDGRRVVYDHDALGRRVEKRVFVGGSATAARRVLYAWSGAALVLEQASDRPKRTFVHRPFGFEPLLHEERGEVFLYVLDQVGVPRELLDARGRVAWSGRFSAWGALEEEYVDPYRVSQDRAVSTPFRLLGQVFDEETGLAWTRFRVWDASTGRWLSPDPLGVFGGGNLFGLDRSPAVFTDVWGLARGAASHPTNQLPRDAAVGGTPPPALPLNRPISQSPTQNARLQADIAAAQAAGGTDFRVNQQQVDANGVRTGINRPDLQYTDANGQRQYVEYDTPTSGRGPGHAQRIGQNDSAGNTTLLIVP